MKGTMEHAGSTCCCRGAQVGLIGGGMEACGQRRSFLLKITRLKHIQKDALNVISLFEWL